MLIAAQTLELIAYWNCSILAPHIYKLYKYIFIHLYLERERERGGGGGKTSDPPGSLLMPSRWLSQLPGDLSTC
jgi:hypothetical protein